MQNYRVTIKGRGTRHALGLDGKEVIVVRAWDRSEARGQAVEDYFAARAAAKGRERVPGAQVILAGVYCDEWQVVDVKRG